MKWVTVVLAVALVWLQHDLWLAKGGWRDMWRLEAEAENQRQANQSLVLGPGEVYYRILPASEAAAGSAAAE